MHILDQAMAMENEGETLYQSLAREAADEGAAYIFSWLADQEKKHYAALQKMADDQKILAAGSADTKGVRDVFASWRESRGRLNVKTSQVELYRKALDVEHESVRLYEHAAASTGDDKAQALFLHLASEERTHRQIMENIIEFVTKPDFWAENVEFNHLGEEYYL